jgi:hypothetical protein
MNTKLVSLLLPTRGRVSRLDASIKSLMETVNNTDNVELLVRADSDDAVTLTYLQNLVTTPGFNIKTIVKPRGKGYADLHVYCNELCSISSGRFLFLWNDDATMLTPNWDSEISKHDDGKMCSLLSGVEDSRGRDNFLFPIVHRSYYDALGRYSASAHNDTYVHAVCKNFPQIFRRTNIIVQHSAIELIAAKDKTSMEGKACWPETKGLWGQPELENALRTDTAKLAELLKQQG